MYNEVIDGFEQISKDDGVSVVVLTGQGDYYSSGNDLTMFAVPPDGLAALAEKGRELLFRFVDTFIDFPKPIIAAVNGIGLWGPFECRLCLSPLLPPLSIFRVVCGSLFHGYSGWCMKLSLQPRSCPYTHMFIETNTHSNRNHPLAPFLSRPSFSTLYSAIYVDEC